jgi:hypothetical protein
MIDYYLVREDLDERLRRAQHRADVRRMLARSGPAPARRPWTAAVRSSVGLGVVRLGLRLAGTAGQ